METNFMKTFLVLCMLVALISLQGFCFLPSNFVLDTREKVDVPILRYHQVQNEKKGMDMYIVTGTYGALWNIGVDIELQYIRSGE